MAHWRAHVLSRGVSALEVQFLLAMWNAALPNIARPDFEGKLKASFYMKSLIGI